MKISEWLCSQLQDCSLGRVRKSTPDAERTTKKLNSESSESETNMLAKRQAYGLLERPMYLSLLP